MNDTPADVPNPSSGVSRRRLLGSGAAVVGLAAASLALPPNVRAALASPRPAGKRSLQDIKHVVMLMQENRSFDHYYGTLSGVRGFSDPHAMKISNALGGHICHSAHTSPAHTQRSSSMSDQCRWSTSQTFTMILLSWRAPSAHQIPPAPRVTLPGPPRPAGARCAGRFRGCGGAGMGAAMIPVIRRRIAPTALP